MADGFGGEPRPGGLVASLLEDLDRYCDPGSLEVILTVNIPEAVAIQGKRLPVPADGDRKPPPQGIRREPQRGVPFGVRERVLRPESGRPVLPRPLRTVAIPHWKTPASAWRPRWSRTPPDGWKTTPAACRPRRASCAGYSVEGGMMGMTSAIPWSSRTGSPGSSCCSRRHVFREAGGFDERYHMYCEDVELCTRLRLLGYRIVQDRSVRVVHDARRDSHRKWNHLAWHVGSLTRFFLSDVYEEARRG